MTSDRKRRTNRANSLRSTGPKTAAGRAKSARNALRHGLRIPVPSIPPLRAEVRALATKLSADCGPFGPQLREFVDCVAEAQVDLLRIRRERDRRLGELMTPVVPDARDRRLRQDITLDLLHKIRMLTTFDDYERRAVSRRKAAIRALDAARAAAL